MLLRQGLQPGCWATLPGLSEADSIGHDRRKRTQSTRSTERERPFIQSDPIHGGRMIDPDYLEFLARVEYANPLPVAPPSPEVVVEQDGPESKPGPMGSRARRLMRERERFRHVHATAN